MQNFQVGLTSIGGINAYKHNYEKSLKTYFRAVDLYKKSKADTMSYANVFYHIAAVYSDTEKYNLALQFFEKSLSICDYTSNIQYSTDILEEIAIINMHQKKYQKAIDISKRSLEISNKFDGHLTSVKAYQTVALSYIALLNKDSALYYINKWGLTKDSIYSKENRKSITEIQTKYETEKKEQEIITLTKEKELQKAESKNKTYFIIVLGLVILLVFIAFYILTKQQKQKNIQKVAEARIKGMEEEQNRMSRELHDGIGSKLGAFRTKLLLLKNKTITENELNQLVEENTQINKEVRFLSHNLSSPELTGENFDTVLNDFAFKTSHSGNLKVDYNSSIEKKWNKISVTKQTEIYRISQEILHNIVKHSKATEAFIQLMQHDTSLNISAEDNGIGFDTETVKKGIGLKNIYQRVKLLGGTVDINSQINKGTVINIEIPF